MRMHFKGFALLFLSLSIGLISYHEVKARPMPPSPPILDSNQIELRPVITQQPTRHQPPQPSLSTFTILLPPETEERMCDISYNEVDKIKGIVIKVCGVDFPSSLVLMENPHASNLPQNESQGHPSRERKVNFVISSESALRAVEKTNEQADAPWHPQTAAACIPAIVSACQGKAPVQQPPTRCTTTFVIQLPPATQDDMCKILFKENSGTKKLVITIEDVNFLCPLVLKQKLCVPMSLQKKTQETQPRDKKRNVVVCPEAWLGALDEIQKLGNVLFQPHMNYDQQATLSVCQEKTNPSSHQPTQALKSDGAAAMECRNIQGAVVITTQPQKCPPQKLASAPQHIRTGAPQPSSSQGHERKQDVQFGAGTQPKRRHRDNGGGGGGGGGDGGDGGNVGDGNGEWNDVGGENPEGELDDCCDICNICNICDICDICDNCDGCGGCDGF